MNNYKEKIYAGILGKAIGVRLGAPIEPYQWTYDKIKEYFGEITGYLKDSEKFAADDDTNGPVFFIRSIIDEPGKVTHKSISHAWLNYTREHQGMFWWGGDNVSTEHTAYNKLAKGYIAPESGSAKLNGEVIANQIGGQIFIDSWGLINPGDIKAAVKDAEIAASVSHDELAITGGQFIAGCVAGAFIHKDTLKLINDVLDHLDNDHYVDVILDIIQQYKKSPYNFRDTYDYIAKKYNYDIYPGACHIIPNAAIVALSLLYSQNDFAKGIEVCVMCGWDTDSNAGVVGAILGVLNGLDNIPWHYREPINDLFIASSMSPTLNYVDIPKFTDMLIDPESEKSKIPGIHLTFNYPGASHGLKVLNDFRVVKDKMTQTSTQGFNVLIDNLIENDEAGIYLKTMYYVRDFPDDRYQPILIPRVYPGQTLEITYSSKIDFIDDLWIAPFIELKNGKKITLTDYEKTSEDRNTVSVKIPETNSQDIVKAGLLFKTYSQPIDGNALLGRFMIHEFKVFGNAKYTIDFNNQEEYFAKNVTPFSNHNVITQLQRDFLSVETKEKRGVTLTGDYYTKNFEISAKMSVSKMEDLMIAFGIKGLENYHFINFTQDKLQLMHRNFLKENLIHEIPYSLPNKFDFKLTIKDNNIKVFINSDLIYEYHCARLNRGHFGFGGINSSFSLGSINISIEGD